MSYAAGINENLVEALKNWFNENLPKGKALPPKNEGVLCLGSVAYGSYVNTLLDYCLPSLMTENNITALKGSWLLIHTDESGQKKISESDIIKKIEDSGIDISYIVFPEILLDLVRNESSNKYWLIGAAHSIQLKHAAIYGYGFHLLMPDHVYSKSYFYNLKHLIESGENVIVQGALSCVLEDVVEHFANDGVLSIEATKLNEYGIKYLHPQAKIHLMNGKNFPDECPINSYMVFVGNDAAHILSPHTTPVYLSNEIARNAPIRLFNTIDSQIPFIVNDSTSVYLPTPEDDMYYLEMSSRNKPVVDIGSSDLVNFIIRFWMCAFCEGGFLRYIDMDNKLAFPNDYSPDNPMDDDEIRKIRLEVMHKVRKLKPDIMDALDPVYHKDPLPQRA